MDLGDSVLSINYREKIIANYPDSEYAEYLREIYLEDDYGESSLNTLKEAEQLYLIKGNHSGSLKKKFNHLLNVCRQYEKEVVKYTDSEQCEIIYDQLMEILILVKQKVND